MGKIEITDFFSMSKDHPLYDYIRQKLIIEGKSPDEDSNFDKNTRKYRRLSNEEFLSALEKEGYDVLIIHEDISDEEAYLHGYIAYQRKGKQKEEMHIFKPGINEEVNGNRRLVTKLTRQCLEHVREKFKKVVFDKDSRAILEFLNTKESYYDISTNLGTSSLIFLPVTSETGQF